MIQLTHVDDGPIWVNPDHIVAIWPMPQGYQGCRLVLTPSEEFVRVTETAGHIIRLVEEKVPC